eukprot:TRINITY_DN8491_c0_g1_i1.p1 TRINITY_DN8491_c0_g1~~TRINITY_DN8491_c0_g1_i1.p1  ORF type:complete len:1851 (-),score=371.48 TRINITY_DN8491_c0_g1_i1:296-5575(-)
MAGATASGAARSLLRMLVLVFLVQRCGGLPSGDKLRNLEREELDFARNSLLRELQSKSIGGQLEENAIRRAHRKIALRYRQNLMGSNTEKFEFQMRVLNLARDALVRGEVSSSTADGEGGNGSREDSGPEGPGRELPAGSRMSEDILKQIFSWQEYALEENVRFDSPETPFFVGHTLHGFRTEFENNWTEFVRTELVEMWPAAARLRLHVEMHVGEKVSEHGDRARLLGYAARQLAWDALSAVAGTLHACGAVNPPLEGVLPHPDDTASWVDLQLRSSKALRNLFSDGRRGAFGARSDSVTCAEMADQDTQLSLLELNLQALVQLEAEEGNAGGRRQDILAELRAAQDAAAVARMREVPLHCQEVAYQRRETLNRLWEDYQFGAVVVESYPLDECSLNGLASFLERHTGRGGELLENKAEPDKTVLRGIRGLFLLQTAVARPAALDRGQWRDAITDLEAAVWNGVAFPELHEAAGRLMAEVVGAGLLPVVLEVALEHPPVRAGGVQGDLGREPGVAEPSRSRRFGGLNVPGYSMKPIERYEEVALANWGDEDREENWDPVRLALSFIDLVPACDMPIQIAFCFLSAALWFWRALQLLGDNCGGDAWLDDYIFEDLWSVPPEGKRLAMTFALKRAILELVEYASLFAEHHLQPGARLAVHHTAYLTLWHMTKTFGAAEDASRLLDQFRRLLNSARLNPFWAPPVMQVSDAVFADILGSRLHSAFLEGLQQAAVGLEGRDFSRGSGVVAARASTGPPVPGAVLEHCLYEGTIMGLGDLVMDPAAARYSFMGALLRDAGRRPWASVEVLVAPSPLRLDPAGFAAGRRPTWPMGISSASLPSNPEFVALRGVRIDLATGHASLLLTRPVGPAFPVLALDDLVELLGIQDQGPVHLAFERPGERGGARQYPHHPFQRVTVGGGGLGRRTELTLLHAAFGLQQVAAGNEVAMKAPFPLRPCDQGLCQELPRTVRSQVVPLRGLPGEPWDPAPRLVAECKRLRYSQRMDGGTLEVLFGTPELEVNPGKQLSTMNEEAFKSWSVEKLRMALRQVEDINEWEDPAIEKHELVDRLLRAIERGRFLEDEDEKDPLARFSRRFTYNFQAIAERWPHFGRLGPLCALRTAGLVLQGQVQQMNQSVMAQREQHKAGVEAHAHALRQQQTHHWQHLLADIHAQVLQQLGFVDLDPAGCFAANGDTRSFARCCSIGDHAAECWKQGEPQGQGVEGLLEFVHDDHDARTQRLRCCGPAARRSNLNMQLVAAVAGQLGSVSSKRPSPEELIPAVSAWLHDPTGVASDGKLLSSAVIDLLADDVQQDEILRGVDDQLRAPVERLAADLAKFKPHELGLVRNEGQETWLPVPPVASSGGRRVLYVTIALAPELEAVAEEDLEPAGGKHRAFEAIGLDELLARSSERSLGSVPPTIAADVDVLHEAALLLSRLSERSEEMVTSSTAASSRDDYNEEQVALDDPEDCSVDGWRDLPNGAEARVAAVSSGEQIRMRRRLSEDVNGEIGTMEALITLTGRPGELVELWQVSSTIGGPTQYIDPADETLVVSVRCHAQKEAALARQGGGLASGDLDQAANASALWPACVEVDMAFPSNDGSGIFVNMEAINITSGCFLNDCSHSDHFACTSPADCARTCSKVRACRWWTYQELAPPTCWLRGESVRTREEMEGYSSGSRLCLPPPEAVKAEAEPVLFDLVRGKAGVPPSRFWGEWEVVETLEDFGNFTVAELERTRPTERQVSALRLAALAASKCADTWRGCD